MNSVILKAALLFAISAQAFAGEDNMRRETAAKRAEEQRAEAQRLRAKEPVGMIHIAMVCTRTGNTERCDDGTIITHDPNGRQRYYKYPQPRAGWATSSIDVAGWRHYDNGEESILLDNIEKFLNGDSCETVKNVTFCSFTARTDE